MKPTTLLHRQIHPTWVQNGRVSTQAFESQAVVVASLAFIPSDKDRGKLSVYNGDKFTAEGSFIHFTTKHSAIGVLSVSVAEVEKVGDLVPFEDNDPFDGHTVIDYNHVNSKGQIKKKAATLRDLAMKRGWTHWQQ